MRTRDHAKAGAPPRGIRHIGSGCGGLRQSTVGALALVLIACAWLGWAVTLAAGAGRPALRWRLLTLPVPAHGSFSYAEPGIAIGPDGYALADAATANTGAPPTFWLSRDAGDTWASGQDVDTTGTSTGDADAAIGPDGYLYALNLGYNSNPPGQPTNPTVLVFRSRDGRRWSGPASFSEPHGLDQPDRPWLIVNPFQPANVDVLNSEGGGNIVIWRSLDHGADFSGPYPVTGGANSQAALALSSRPLLDPTHEGRLFMLYETATPSGAVTLAGAGTPIYEFPMTQLWLASSTDAGLTWTNRPVLDTATLSGLLRGATLGHLLVASAIDAAGRLYAAFSLRPAGSTETRIFLVHSTDHGARWSAPSELDAPTNSNVMPALAVTRAGVAYLSWYGSQATDFRNGIARWAEMFAEIPNPLAPHPTFTVSQVSGPVPVHVGGIDTAGAIGSDLGDNWGLRDFQSIAVDACGRPHLVWADDNATFKTMSAFPAQPCTMPRRGQTPTASGDFG